MRVQRTFAAATAVCLLLVCAPARAAWIGESTMLGGTHRYDQGEWIYQDFVYDDYGADTAPVNQGVVALAPTTGDFRYPDDPDYGNNAADILEVRVRQVGSDLEVRVTLNTLLAADSTVIGVAMSRGAGSEGAWPFGAGVRSVWEEFVTIAGRAMWRSVGNADPASIGEADVDLAANTVTFSVPGWGQGAGIDLNVGSGLWDPAKNEWLAGASFLEPDPGNRFNSGGPTAVRVFDLAFNTRLQEPRGGDWQEDAQAAALAGGDVTAFARSVVFARLTSGETEPVTVVPGYYNRLFVSRQDLGEGIDGSFPQYRGKVQPYGLWVPTGYEASTPTPLALLLHSLSVHHNQYAGEPSYNTMYEQLDSLGAIVVTPLGRGPDGWYWDEGLVDTLEVWDDVREHYNVDPERTSTTGYSMGGYGTYRLATMMPDRFAAAVSWVGPPAYQIWPYPLDPVPGGDRQGSGNTYEQLESMLHVPIMIVHGTNDELVPVTGVNHQADRFAELGYEYRFDLHPGMDHFLFVFTNEWSREAAWLADHPARVVDPARVRFEVRPASWGSTSTIFGHLEALGANLDSAYWVSDVVVAEPGDVTGVVDLTSEAITAREPVTTPEIDVQPGPPTPFVRRGLRRTWSDLPVANVLRGTLAEVSELTVDLDRAGLGLADLTIEIDVDRSVILHLKEGDTITDRILQPTP